MKYTTRLFHIQEANLFTVRNYICVLNACIKSMLCTLYNPHDYGKLFQRISYLTYTAGRNGEDIRYMYI